jgi:hypothetical protein
VTSRDKERAPSTTLWIALWCPLNHSKIALVRAWIYKRAVWQDDNLVYRERKRKKMRQKYLLLGVSTIMLACAAIALAQSPQQDKSKRLSPHESTEVTLKGKKITIEYGRPYLKGRKLGQELAPYGKVWRTGADEATAFTTEIDLNIGGTKVPAGKYTLYTLPSEGTWKLIINKQTGQWGTKYDESQDLARIDMQKTKLSQPVEQFTISFDKKNESTANLNLDWENTRVWVVVKAE